MLECIALWNVLHCDADNRCEGHEEGLLHSFCLRVLQSEQHLQQSIYIWHFFLIKCKFDVLRSSTRNSALSESAFAKGEIWSTLQIITGMAQRPSSSLIKNWLALCVHCTPSVRILLFMIHRNASRARPRSLNVTRPSPICTIHDIVIINKNTSTALNSIAFQRPLIW